MTNPIMNKVIKRDNTIDNVIDENNIMTINGTINTTLVMTLLLMIAAAFVYSRFVLGYTDIAVMLTGIGLIAGFALALIISFTKNTTLVPFYSVAEGFFLGGITAQFEASHPGIALNAITGTFAALISMLILYKSGIIKCTEKFRSVVFISTASIAVIYLMNFVGNFFGYSIPHLFSSSNVGIAISLFVIAIASLNLIVDFDFIEKGAQMMLPKKYEWLGAFGLMVTLVWLYVEILRLIASLQNRN